MQRVLQIHRRLPPLAIALRETLREGYGRRELRADLLAGVSVGIIAVPLALALAIASGVPPQHGLYTAIVAGLLIALAGGSRFNVSGPTAAFVVILQPIAAQHGVGGLLLATFMAGVMLVAMGWGRAGQLIQFIPYPVTTGFTAGIAVVIASLQLSDFLGLPAAGSSHFVERMLALLRVLPEINPAEAALGSGVLLLLALWPRLGTRVPAYLAGAVVAAAAAYGARSLWPDCGIVTIADRFAYSVDGVVHAGIPAMLPVVHWPWQLPGADGTPMHLDFDLLRSLLGPAFAIAMLGAIESLLCAVVADGMTGRKHDPDAELVAQGLGNIAAPLFGGIPATGALARTAANVRAGARSPLASVFHALFVLAAMLLLAPVLSWLPMSGLAALLLMVAWNMSERHNVLRILRVAPRGDVLLLLVCFGLTVFFDMVIAVGFGVVLASLFFMHRMSRVAMVTLVGDGDPHAPRDLPEEVRYYRIAGPLFFGAAERAMAALRRHDHRVRALVLDLSAVPTIDATGLVALEELLDELHEAGVFVALCGAQRSVLGLLREGGYTRQAGARWYFASADAAVRWWQRGRAANS
ncbi:MAG: C4-dicarboxylic acid transporter DauA [Pseudomonadota bacterium]|nr:C4-dicarboxylic acid transporter DauA [Pseudomonadota bacterium]